MRFEIYRSRYKEEDGSYTYFGMWYWRLRARNGRIIADGSEGYASRRGVLRAIQRLNDAFIYSGKYIDYVEVES